MSLREDPRVNRFADFEPRAVYAEAVRQFSCRAFYFPISCGEKRSSCAVVPLSRPISGITGGRTVQTERLEAERISVSCMPSLAFIQADGFLVFAAGL